MSAASRPVIVRTSAGSVSLYPEATSCSPESVFDAPKESPASSAGYVSSLSSCVSSLVARRVSTDASGDAYASGDCGVVLVVVQCLFGVW